MYRSWPFLLHILLEVPAGFNFLLRPGEQLPQPAPGAHSLIRQYAILLLASCLISLIFWRRRPCDLTSRRVAGALAVYHVGPLVRASSRLWHTYGGSDEEAYGRAGGGPVVHAIVHASALGFLARLWMEKT